jgi:N-acetylmuramate 1-kinase
LQSTGVDDPRLRRLTDWTKQVLGRDDLDISVASADASFRRYFRVRGLAGVADTRIVMDAPPDKEDIAPYVRVATMLVAAGVNAPRVLAQNSTEGFLLLDDLGNLTYLAALETLSKPADTPRIGGLYGDALDALVKMQSGCDAGARALPHYDSALLKREMELFPEWFVNRHLGVALRSDDRALLDAAFAVLIDSALAQPRVFVHRDYHSRNLMVVEQAGHGRNPGVLDFQDAVYGPITYDAVSLLRDCYVAWPLERVHDWLREYRNAARQAGLDVGRSEDEWRRWFDLMGVQRHLKAIGIFARLWHRDGKQGYLKDIPRTLSYIRSVIPAYPELHGLGTLIESSILPAIKS